MVQKIQPSFAAGELGPELYARIDLAKYAIGVRTMLNWFVHAQGGASNRAGTQWIGEVIDSDDRGRLIPFEFSTVQTYVLEFGDLKMRVLKDGGYVLEGAKSIEAATKANPGSIQITGHGYSTGDRVFATGAGGMTQLNGRFFDITVSDANNFTIGVDTSSYGTWTSGGSFARVYTIASPFALADLATLKYEQSADTMTFTHPSYAPRSLTRTGHTSWAFSTIAFAPTTAAPTGFVSSAGGGSVFYAVTAISDETGEESLPLLGDAATSSSTLTWTPTPGCSRYNIYNLRQGIYGLIGSSGITGFTDGAVVSDASITPPSARNPFNGANSYPGCSTYHDGRQWFGRTNNSPQTLWGSASAAFNNMSVSQPAKDSDAITRTLASRQVNEIKHIIGLTQMLVLTSGAEWKVSAGQADVITPAQFVARPQSYNGCSDIRPIVANSTLLYVPPAKKSVRTLQYQWSSDAWTGADMTLLAPHLFKSQMLVNWQYAKDPDSICWAVRDDGVLLGFTFMQEQDVYAWHRHTTANGVFEDVCTIREGNESAVYFIVRRTIGGVTKRYVERLHSRYFATLSDAWFLDCAVQQSGSATTTVSGLWHLIGQEVWALADGAPDGPHTVSALGQIMLSTAAAKVTTGKLYPNCDLETLSIELQDQQGTLQGRKKKVNKVAVMVTNSADQGVQLGPSGGQGEPIIYDLKKKDLINPLAAAPSTAPALIDDVMQTISAPSWDWHGRILIRQTLPLPITITGIMPDVTAGT